MGSTASWSSSLLQSTATSVSWVRICVEETIDSEGISDVWQIVSTCNAQDSVVRKVYLCVMRARRINRMTSACVEGIANTSAGLIKGEVRILS